MEEKLLKEVLGLCYEISNMSKADVFFNYFSHTNTFDVCYHLKGFKGDIGTDIKNCEKITTENLREAINELEKLKEAVSK